MLSVAVLPDSNLSALMTPVRIRVPATTVTARIAATREKINTRIFLAALSFTRPKAAMML